MFMDGYLIVGRSGGFLRTRAAGLEGAVVVGFVVDTVGRADPESITVVASTNEGFDRSNSI